MLILTEKVYKILHSEKTVHELSVNNKRWNVNITIHYNYNHVSELLSADTAAVVVLTQKKLA